ncbi:MAG: recombinase family protein, partial [Planctomycetes bacterium]|nr:recombinase family protein [Planctomycetota bacterium]
IDQGYTGANTKRPALNEMMSEARKRKFDVLLVWKLDRLSRSLKDLINTLDELGHLEIDLSATKIKQLFPAVKSKRYPLQRRIHYSELVL